ncbi:hypothetical protein K3740_05895 [Ruegeria conchae]|nr:hypothetical protein K3740_05895 [Ruegeria conchae]
MDKLRKVRPWFFEQDGGWYVLCKYGNKALTIGNGNAVFVKTLKDIAVALNTLKAATEAGELDEAIGTVVTKRSKSRS